MINEKENMGLLGIHDDRKMIVGVGSALVDMLAQEDDEFLELIGVPKGGMNLVENHFIEDLLDRASRPPSVVPGGSACNTAIGVSKLGGASRFIGKMGPDELGALFHSDLKKHNVEPLLFMSENPTGRVVSVITPDAQRSMFTHLGAASEMLPEELTPECFRDAAVVHVEGYLLFNRELMMAALKSAKTAGALVSLDLASFNVVEESRDILNDIIEEYIDILIANEDEARAFTGDTDEAKALAKLSENTDIAVLKLGSRGSVVSVEGKITAIPGMGSGSALDTTGAGDLWASGFLFGMVNGYSVEASGMLGSACGYEVCQVIGASIASDGWDRIRKLL